MSFWLHDGLKIGSRVLDLSHQFVSSIAKEYDASLGRKPTTEEFLHILNAAIYNHEERYLSDIKGAQINLIAKRSKRPKKQRYIAGDLIVLEMDSGIYAHLIATPQFQYFELFSIRSKRPMSNHELSRISRVKLPYTISADPIFEWKWKVVGNLSYSRDKFSPRHFLMGSRTTCGDSVFDGSGFLLVDSSLRVSTESERKEFPKFRIMGEEVIEDFKLRLKDEPIFGA